MDIKYLSLKLNYCYFRPKTNLVYNNCNNTPIDLRTLVRITTENSIETGGRH